MQCQQWEISGYPKSSSDVLKADRAPPADALELLPERLWRTWIAVGQPRIGLAANHGTTHHGE